MLVLNFPLLVVQCSGLQILLNLLFTAFYNTEQSSIQQCNYSHSNLLRLVETNNYLPVVVNELKGNIVQNSPTAVHDYFMYTILYITSSIIACACMVTVAGCYLQFWTRVCTNGINKTMHYVQCTVFLSL